MKIKKMKIKNLLMLAILTTTLTSCKELPYKSDIAFMNSALANSPEYLITLNKSTCKDTDGKVGLCAKRVKTTEDLIIRVPAQQYSYAFNLDCSDNINSDIRFDVLKNQIVEHVIKKEKYAIEEVFNCTIDIFPHERPEGISAFASFRVYVTKGDYINLEVPMKYNDYYVFGEHALFVKADKKSFNKKTWVEDSSINKISVESHNMRFSYLGY